MFLLTYLKHYYIPEDFIEKNGENLLEDALKSIAENFSEDWLAENKGHPLQILWNRNDFIAFRELFTLGISINKLKNNDWLKRNLKKIKSLDSNIRIGAVFEVICAAMIEMEDNQTVIFPKKDNPGYDFSIQFDSGLMNVSCKNYGYSNAFKQFNKQSKLFESCFIKSCKKLGIKAIQFLVNTNIYPETNNWDYLKQNLHSVLHVAKEAGIGNFFQNFDLNNWQIAISRVMKEDKTKLYKELFSYNLLISSAFHKNEMENLFSKLDDACHNLIKHSKKQNNNEINVLFIHLSTYASLDVVEKWAKYYLKNNLNKPISGILFIQPYVERNYQKKTYNIVYGIRLVKNEHYTKWYSNNDCRLLKLAIMTGSHSYSGLTRKFIINDEGDVGNVGVDPNSIYFFQRGKIYFDDLNNENIKISVNSPGVHEYRIYKREDKLLLDEPIMPVDENLILI